MAWTWCISSKPQAPPAQEQAIQVRILADAYGLDIPARSSLVDAILDRQIRNALWWRQHLNAPQPHAADNEQVHARIAWSRREHDYTTDSRTVFASALR